MIHVCFGLHDKTGRYSKFTGTAMLSMFENTDSKITVHILHDSTLTQDNRDKFIYLAGQYNQRVKFYNVEELCPDKITELKASLSKNFKDFFTIAAMYRFLISQLLSADIEKAIYLDSDTVVNLDINELYQIKLDSRPLGAIAESATDSFQYKTNAALNPLITDGVIRHDDYFNSGVLVMNLKIFRDMEEPIRRGIKFIAEQSQPGYMDQDALNYLFAKTYFKLPVKFNSFVREEARCLPETTIQKIYHYAGHSIGLDMRDPFNRLWLKYFFKTPWFDEETIGRLYESFQKFYDNLKISKAKLSATMIGKTRAFFVHSSLTEFVKKNFLVRDDEEIIPADSEKSLPILVCAMGKARGQKIFFIVVPDFQIVNIVLTKIDFVQGKDFLNGLEFLSEAQGVPMNSYPLIQAM